MPDPTPETYPAWREEWEREDGWRAGKAEVNMLLAVIDQREDRICDLEAALRSVVANPWRLDDTTGTGGCMWCGCRDDDRPVVHDDLCEYLRAHKALNARESVE